MKQPQLSTNNVFESLESAILSVFATNIFSCISTGKCKVCSPLKLS